jgi:hypothetical protein
MLLSLPTASPASTAKAWAAGDEAARAACLKASGLIGATASRPVPFSDRTAQTVVLVTGRYPQRFMKGATGMMLCLYDRRAKRAEVQEPMDWMARQR